MRLPFQHRPRPFSRYALLIIGSYQLFPALLVFLFLSGQYLIYVLGLPYPGLCGSFLCEPHDPAIAHPE